MEKDLEELQVAIEVEEKAQARAPLPVCESLLDQVSSRGKAEAQIRFISRVASDSPHRGRVHDFVNQV